MQKAILLVFLAALAVSAIELRDVFGSMACAACKSTVMQVETNITTNIRQQVTTIGGKFCQKLPPFAVDTCKITLNQTTTTLVTQILKQASPEVACRAAKVCD
ncbi:unnamed protein product, partial [Mesorhabditis spiculigera]